MTHSYGLRSGTRSLFARGFRQHGRLNATTYLRTYKVGDIVDIKANGNVQKGMPHKFYHGRTGRVWIVTPRAVGIVVNKRVGPRIIAKKIYIRVDHVKPNNARIVAAERRAAAKAEKKAAKAAGKPLPPKARFPALPTKAFFVNPRDTEVETIAPLKYELLL
ncbi:S60 ribosomal protein L21 [Cavenderia fasciculata]|uniref:S60 ribosomal protein L21 n=1 Tax=Cavenderia fasciculata TaxID=261658 RepID=F4PXY7_CACFS|nr:S60 ribosomal protein L21 [Cavenderia fasciculata]EGG19647.1 S60 ribosomal protein L21 [Cavenderia fasciculata]|eukprot:XP_004357941.1 S60 ribosomal protein L21 [Cavenderia fasciculata]